LRLCYLISSDYARTTGGWIYNERLLAELAALGWQTGRHDLPPGFPDPSPSVRAEAEAIIRRLPAGALTLADQVCISPLAEAARRVRLAMIMHHPQILEGSRPAEVAARLDAEERAAVSAAKLVIATSRLTGRQMLESYGVPPARLVIAEPGTDVFPPSAGCGGPGVHLLSIGSVIPRKRHGLIIEALAGLAGLDWRLTIVGNVAWQPEHIASLRYTISQAGLGSRILLVGEQTGQELEAQWRRADVYVAASIHEGFGMAVAEAVARQIPVVSTRSGAVGEWMDPAAGVIVEPDDVSSLRAALRDVIGKPAIRAKLREGARSARASLPTWPQSTAKVDAALRAIS